MEEFKENGHLQAPKTDFGDLPQPREHANRPCNPHMPRRTLTHQLCSSWLKMKNLANDRQLPYFLSFIYK